MNPTEPTQSGLNSGQTRPEACCDSVLLSTCCPAEAKPTCCGRSPRAASCGCQAGGSAKR